MKSFAAIEFQRRRIPLVHGEIDAPLITVRTLSQSMMQQFAAEPAATSMRRESQVHQFDGLVRGRRVEQQRPRTTAIDAQNRPKVRFKATCGAMAPQNVLGLAQSSQIRTIERVLVSQLKNASKFRFQFIPVRDKFDALGPCRRCRDLMLLLCGAFEVTQPREFSESAGQECVLLTWFGRINQRLDELHLIGIEFPCGMVDQLADGVDRFPVVGSTGEEHGSSSGVGHDQGGFDHSIARTESRPHSIECNGILMGVLEKSLHTRGIGHTTLRHQASDRLRPPARLHADNAAVVRPRTKEPATISLRNTHGISSLTIPDRSVQ